MTSSRALSSFFAWLAAAAVLLQPGDPAFAQAAGSFAKLRSDEPNYIVYATSSDDDTLAEDAHVEFLLSLRYPLVEAWFERRHARVDARISPLIPSRLLLVYNGLYDF